MNAETKVKCPKCHGTEIYTTMPVCTIIIDGEIDRFDLDGYYAWQIDKDEYATCGTCDFDGKIADFQESQS